MFEESLTTAFPWPAHIFRFFSARHLQINARTSLNLSVGIFSCSKTFLGVLDHRSPEVLVGMFFPGISGMKNMKKCAKMFRISA